MRHRIQSFYISSIGLSIVAFFICFFALGVKPFANWDEAFYAEMTRQMIKSQELFVLYWNGSAYLDKPPLFIWLTSLSSLLFGLNEFAVRFPSAVAGFVTILLTTYYAYKKLGAVPALFSFAAIACNSVFIWRARDGDIDATATLLVLLAYLAMIYPSPHRYVRVGIVLGLLYLTKLTLMFLPAAGFILWEALHGLPIRKHLKGYITVGLIALSIIITWLYIGYQKVGVPFLQYYLLRSDQGTLHPSLQNANLEYIKYIQYSLPKGFILLFLLGIFYAVWKRDKEMILASFFSLFLVAILSFNTHHNNWYLMPSMPFWAVLIAYSVQRIARSFKNKIIICTLLIFGFVLSVYAFKNNILPMFSDSSNIKEWQAAITVKKLTQPTDTIYRLDHNYPLMIYYAERKVIPSTADTGREGLVELIKTGRARWLSGTVNEVIPFLESQHIRHYDKIQVNDEEIIIHLL